MIFIYHWSRVYNFCVFVRIYQLRQRYMYFLKRGKLRKLQFADCVLLPETRKLQTFVFYMRKDFLSENVWNGMRVKCESLYSNIFWTKQLN